MRLTHEPLSQKLVNSRSSLRQEFWSVGSPGTGSVLALDLDSQFEWSVRKETLHGGRQEGVEVIVVSNGVLEFTIVPTRGMNLWEAHAGDGFRLGWDSPVKEIVHPSFVHLDTRGGLGWLEGFGEFMNRCGLASVGSPGPDVVASNTGAPVEVNLTLHGKVSYLPASEVELIIEPPPSRRIRVRGIVDETMMFGTNLRLVTEIWTEPGSSTIHIEDEVQNLGDTSQEMQLIYHTNFGRPLLENGAKLVAPVARVWPRDERAAEGGLAGWNEYAEPVPGFVEQVFFLTLHGDGDGRTETVLRNASGDRGVSMRFSTRELPCMTLWKNTQGERDGYVTGLEPGTSYPNHRRIEREAGRVPRIEPGESYRATLEITALRLAEEVRTAEARVRAIAAGRAPEIQTAPE